MENDKEREIAECAAKLTGSLLLFTRTFFQLRTGRKFQMSKPVGRESHFITISRALTKVFRGEINNLYIGVPPRYAKTEFLIHFVAFALARYPDCNFIYTSYSYSLAAKQTKTIRDIVSLREYKELFHVNLNQSSTAKHDFETTDGGSVYAAGLGGTITGRGAGIKAIDRFGGCIIVDDAHKPDEAESDVVREGVIEWFDNTLLSRRNDGNRTPVVVIGQRVHEHDLPAALMERHGWETLILPAMDEVGNALYPEMHSKEDLLEMKDINPYVFASQYQQNPQPAGGGLFKKDWFALIEDEPSLLTTFITADTAETDKEYNDATVFSFWGIYKITHGDIETAIYGLHWIDCIETRIEPKDLKDAFMEFYYGCMRHKVKPSLAAIEKKSTGTTLVSVLKDIQGLQIVPIERTKASGSKTNRFLDIQPYLATKRVSLCSHANHTQMCLDHCAKITANNTHRFDDIADTLADAVKIALIDEAIVKMYINPSKDNSIDIIHKLVSVNNKINRLREARSW